MNATQAINISQQQDRIVHIEYTEANEDVLLDMCDDHTHNGNLTEYWGADTHGTWRVHMSDE